eukprot:503518_1
MQKDRKKKKMKIESAIKRLMYDLKEVQRENLMHVSVVPEDDNVFKWHCNLKNVQGIFQNVYIHLTLEFPTDYPSNPPQIKLITKLPDDMHPNIEDNTVCLPLFGADNYRSGKSKYGSSWSAAYSITSLLVNIGSIFGEIEIGKKEWGVHTKHTISKKHAQKVLSRIRATHCARCGHSHSTPYPVLGVNKLPFEIVEMNANEQHYKHVLNDAIQEKNKAKEKRIVQQEQKDRARGVLIAGNIIETIKNGVFWMIKSQQSIDRKYVETVSWQFTLDMFDRKSKSAFHSDYIFGFVDDENVFFGVNADGHVVYNNDETHDKKEEEERVRIKAHDIMTYILHFNHSNGVQRRDELYLFLNYKFIASVLLPASYVKCDSFYPVMYVKDIRLHLTLDADPKLLDVVKQRFDRVDVFNQLQSSYMINSKDTIETAGVCYRDQVSWDVLLERSLNSDVLLDIFTYLTYSDLVHCAEVNTFWYSVLSGHNVLDRVEMRCFYTHESIDAGRSRKRKNGCILGVGLNVNRSSNKWITSVESEMDLLSLSAYKDYSIYSGAWGERITHFIPLIINEKHAAKSKKCLLKRLAMICDESSFNVRDGLMVVTAIMNQFVVQLMANTIGLSDAEKKEDDDDEYEKRKIDPKHASEKALIGYCAFHHMLLYLVQEYPEMQTYARGCIQDFIAYPSSREKSSTPDLGKFILMMAIVEDYEWEDIATVFIHESLDRQVKWYLRKYPQLESLDASKCSPKERIACTLKSTMISRRLVAFQVFFLKNICAPRDGYSLSDLLMNYNKRWGQPTSQQKRLLQRKVNEILLKKDDMKSWLRYFDQVGLTKYETNAQVCNALKRAVTNSKNKEYHRANQGRMRRKRLRNKSAVAPSVSFSVEEAKLSIGENECVEMIGEVVGHRDSITCIRTMVDDPDRIVTGSRDKSMIVWALSRTTTCARSGETRLVMKARMIRRFEGHNHFVSDLDVSADAQYVLSASWDGLLRLWNMKSGSSRIKFIGHSKDVLSVCFSPDNRHIISAGRDQCIYLWNTVGEMKQAIHDAHNGWISCITFSPNPEENVFVSASYDKSVKVWKYDAASLSYKLKYELRNHRTCVTACAISPDGSLCASCDKYGEVCLWDIDGGKLLSTISAQTSGEQINCVVFSPNRYWLCFAVGGAIEICDLESKENVAILRETQSLMHIRRRKHFCTDQICNCIAWSNDGKTLYAGYSNKKIRIWQIISTK